MIKVYREQNKIIIKGHADYDDYGKDIVCASVSSIVITTVNAKLEIDRDAEIYKEKRYFNYRIIKTRWDNYKTYKQYD